MAQPSQKQKLVSTIPDQPSQVSPSHTDFIYPLGFSDFTRIRKLQKVQYSVKDYHHILKLKKMLQATQKKMENRIGLFKKAANKIVRKRCLENSAVMKINSVNVVKNQRKRMLESRFIIGKGKENGNGSEGLRNSHQIGSNSTKALNVNVDVNGYMEVSSNLNSNQEKESRWCSNVSVRDGLRSAKLESRAVSKYVEREKGQLALTEIQNRIVENKRSVVQGLREEKQRFKIIIEERKKQQVNRNLRSAQAIRKNRQNVKVAKEQMLKERKEMINQQIEGKIKREKEGYLELERNLDWLQNEEREALIEWKKTLDG